MASAVDSIIMDPIESALDSVGLMQGTAAPVKRAVVGVGIGAAITFGAQPSIAFDDEGNVRPWAMMSDDENATQLPWWMIVGFPAFVLSVLI